MPNVTPPGASRRWDETRRPEPGPTDPCGRAQRTNGSLSQGDPGWLGLALGFEILSFVGGIALWTGLLPGGAPVALTLVPAAFGAIVIGAALAMPRGAAGLEARLRRRAARADRAGRLAGRVAAAPRAIAEGVREALCLARRGNPGVAGAARWWAFDIAALWACFQAFGVDPGLAVLSVLAYRLAAFWLPTAPGVVAYLQLRRTVASWEREDAGEAPPLARAPRAEPRLAPVPCPEPALATA